MQSPECTVCMNVSHCMSLSASAWELAPFGRESNKHTGSREAPLCRSSHKAIILLTLLLRYMQPGAHTKLYIINSWGYQFNVWLEKSREELLVDRYRTFAKSSDHGMFVWQCGCAGPFVNTHFLLCIVRSRVVQLCSLRKASQPTGHCIAMLGCDSSKVDPCFKLQQQDCCVLFCFFRAPCGPH